MSKYETSMGHKGSHPLKQRNFVREKKSQTGGVGGLTEIIKPNFFPQNKDIPALLSDKDS